MSGNEADYKRIIEHWHQLYQSARAVAVDLEIKKKVLNKKSAEIKIDKLISEIYESLNGEIH